MSFAQNEAKQMAKRQWAKHRELYDQKCRGAELEIGDLVLVKQTAWKGRHRIQDKWENEEYQVVHQPTPVVPVYTVKSVAGSSTRVLHINLLLSLQGRIRQEDGMRRAGILDSEDEVEEGDEMPKVARAPHGKSRGPPSLKQVPLSRGRPLVGMPLLTCLGRNLTPCWLVHPHLSTCQGMRIAVRMKCTLTPLHHIPQLVVQPLLIL